MGSSSGDAWPAPSTPPTAPEDQDRRQHPVPVLVLATYIFRDLTAARDRVYNR